MSIIQTADPYRKRRFSGVVVRIYPNVAHVAIDQLNDTATLNRRYCDPKYINFDSLMVHDRLRFCLHKSKLYPSRYNLSYTRFETNLGGQSIGGEPDTRLPEPFPADPDTYDTTCHAE
jgi:hypothetical protein